MRGRYVGQPAPVAIKASCECSTSAAPRELRLRVDGDPRLLICKGRDMCDYCYYLTERAALDRMQQDQEGFAYHLAACLLESTQELN